ncbi:transcriptional regulator [Candidatus Woesearchaeota archaeon]|nr:transcriptional regulator [Candidatus Woesearchaeota archaeon]
MLLQPQEVEVFYILPTIRKELAVAMRAQGKSGKEISKLLGVTEAAVSQYFSKKRGKHVKLPDEVKEALTEAAKRITDTQSMIKETQKIIAKVKDKRLICKIHEQLEDGIPKGCDVCFK